MSLPQWLEISPQKGEPQRHNWGTQKKKKKKKKKKKRRRKEEEKEEEEEEEEEEELSKDFQGKKF